MSYISIAKEKLSHTITLLRLTYGLLFIVAGIDKFFDIITRWGQYVNPKLLSYLSTDLKSFIAGVGIWEILLGFLILICCTRLGAYLAVLWLIAIAVNLVTMGHFYDIAVRDVVMAIGALVLARLINIKKDINKDTNS